MAQIFISYSHRNRDTITTLAHALEEIGNHVWYDREIPGGTLWWENIITNIQKAEIFVFATTPESLESIACKLELDYANKLRKAILPIILSNVDINILPRLLTERQHIDYQRQDSQAAFTLMRAIQRLSLSGFTALPSPLPNPPPVPVSDFDDVRERIAAPENLSSQEQSDIVSRLKDHLREGHSPVEVYSLLRRLKNRPELYARVANEIDAVLVREQRAPLPATVIDKPWWDYSATELRSTIQTIFSKPATQISETPQLPTNTEEPASGTGIAVVVSSGMAIVGVVVFFFIILLLNPNIIGFFISFFVVIGVPVLVVIGLVVLIYKVFQTR
jgi:hypothetical protein